MLTADEVQKHFKRPITVNGKGCWIWGGSISSQGYAIFNNKFVHGIVCGWVGKISLQGTVLCHKCNTRKCVNPEHIYVGTFTDNMVDAIKDGRGKLGEKGYRRIVEMYRKG